MPNGSYTPPNGSPNANNYIDGNPDNAPDYLGPTSPGSNAPGTANAEVDIDWASIVDGSAMTPDYHVNRSVSPATGAFPPSYVNWPVLRITGNLVNGDNFNGQGILIVTGNANFSNITWHGVVLVGGEADPQWRCHPRLWLHHHRPQPEAESAERVSFPAADVCGATGQSDPGQVSQQFEIGPVSQPQACSDPALRVFG